MMDARLHDFKNLTATGVPDKDGDKAFDEESFAAPVGQPFAGVTLVGA